jgi:hypothetical protein
MPEKQKNKNLTKNIITGTVIVGATALLLWAISGGTQTVKNDSISDNNIISRKGPHYHPKLDIHIKGQLQPIPANVGLGITHLPMHTHDTDHIIHLEFSGLVTLDNTRLQEFFKIWGKQFNSNCIFDNCNGPSGTVKMFVNGQPNTEFEKYLMKDDDKIEIRYE